MSIFSADRTLSWWKNQEVYLSSFGCLGLLDGAVITVNRGKLAVVIRGWIFDESGNIADLSVTQGGLNQTVHSYGLERLDVHKVFNNFPQSKNCGFLHVFYPEDGTKVLDKPVQMTFSAKLKNGAIREGSFNAVQVSLNLITMENVGSNAISLLEKYLKFRHSDVTIVCPQLNCDELRHDYKEIVSVVETLGMSYQLLETSMALSKNEAIRFAAIRMFSLNSVFILVGDQARSYFESDIKFLISSHADNRIVYIGEYPHSSDTSLFAPTIVLRSCISEELTKILEPML